MLGLLLLTSLLHFTVTLIEVNDNMKSFSHAKKAAFCFAGKEINLFEHVTGPGVITEQWFAGENCLNNNTIVRYYIDGDRDPTIETNLYMLHGIGFYDASSTKIPPWGTKRIGRTAINGGLYNTIEIPFQKSIRIAFVSKTNGSWWYIVRGVENYPVVVGQLKLPHNAKLVLHKLEHIVLSPLSYINLATSNKNGLLFMIVLAAESVDMTYLEGCFRWVSANQTTQYLSSGTEDMFLSAYYFNNGIFHTDHSGLTYLKRPTAMSAYKFFEDDPILFKNSFNLVWRAGEVCNVYVYNQTCI